MTVEQADETPKPASGFTLIKTETVDQHDRVFRFEAARNKAKPINYIGLDEAIHEVGMWINADKWQAWLALPEVPFRFKDERFLKYRLVRDGKKYICQPSATEPTHDLDECIRLSKHYKHVIEFVRTGLESKIIRARLIGGSCVPRTPPDAIWSSQITSIFYTGYCRRIEGSSDKKHRVVVNKRSFDRWLSIKIKARGKAIANTRYNHNVMNQCIMEASAQFNESTLDKKITKNEFNQILLATGRILFIKFPERYIPDYWDYFNLHKPGRPKKMSAGDTIRRINFIRDTIVKIYKERLSLSKNAYRAGLSSRSNKILS